MLAMIMNVAGTPLPDGEGALPLEASEQACPGIKAAANADGDHAGDGEHRRSVNGDGRERQR